MTPDPTLTDEELAEEERGHVRHRASEGHHDFCRRFSFAWPCPTSRLIAALRASRAEVERLTALAHSNRVEADVMGETAREWEAEVERLREDARENYTRAERAEQELVATRAELAQAIR